MFVDLHGRLELEWQIEGILVHEERHLRLASSEEAKAERKMGRIVFLRSEIYF